MKSFSKTVRNINRIREVVQVLLKYQFRDIILSTALRQYLPLNHGRAVVELNKKNSNGDLGERLRKVAEELGPAFIKFAQLLSNRPDLIPEPIVLEFSKLQSEVPPVAFELVKERIEEELQQPVEELFSYLDKKVLGSASIGQVHRARLKSGEDVVIKVQKPGVRRQLETDLALLKDFVRLTDSYFKSIGVLNASEIIDTFEESIQLELDYQNEARNMELFRKIYREENNFQIPKPYRQLSSDKVLVSEFIGGCKITDTKRLKAWGLDPRKMVEEGMNIYLKQIFDYGFFHADPHPGNILIRPDGTIVLIDFGMVGKLMKSQKFAFAGIFVGLANQDPKAMASNLRNLAVDSEIENLQLFENDINELIEDFLIFDLEEAGLNQFTAHLQKIIYKYQLQIPGSIFLVLRALAILEGIGKKLHPDFSPLDYIKPYGLKLLTEQFSFKNQRSELGYSFSQMVSLMYAFPAEIRFILKKVREGDFNINLALDHYEKYLHKLDRQQNRLLITLILCTLLLSSAIALSTGQHAGTPKVYGIPSLSFWGIILAALLGFALFMYSNWWKPKP